MLPKLNFHCVQKIKKMKKTIKDGGITTMHSKAKVGKKDGLDLKLYSFLVLGNFSKRFKKFRILKNSREISLLDLEAFSFHFSLLEKSESDFHFTFHFSNFQYPLSQETDQKLGKILWKIRKNSGET